MSTQDQNLDMQIQAFEKAGCEAIYSEKITGTRADRPEYLKMKEFVYPQALVANEGADGELFGVTGMDFFRDVSETGMSRAIAPMLAYFIFVRLASSCVMEPLFVISFISDILKMSSFSDF